MTLKTLFNQFISENSFLDRRTYPDKQLHLSRTRESLCGFGHVQNFNQIGRICSPAVKNEWCFIIIILVFSSVLLVTLALQCSKTILVFLAGLFVSSCSIFLPNMIVGNIG